MYLNRPDIITLCRVSRFHSSTLTGDSDEKGGLATTGNFKENAETHKPCLNGGYVHMLQSIPSSYKK